jgi:4-amino-4-deoxy-L-arabinose transferase-like glycosyltransferase
MPDAASVIPGTPAASAERLARTPRAGLALLAVLLAVYLPGLMAIPAVDRDESRFVQASRQMFESVALPPDQLDERPFVLSESGRLTAGMHAGGLAVPMVGDRPRLNKPPLIYWLQAASGAVLTGGDPLADRVWHYRVPSVLSAMLACLLTWRLGVSEGHARAGWLGALLLGICPMVVWDAHQARADQLLLACTTATMVALAAIWRRSADLSARPGWALPLAFWFSLGAGMLAKGPITPLIAATTAMAVSLVAREWRWLRRTRPLFGLAVLAVMIAPWVWSTAEHVGWDTLTRILFDETLGRSTSAKEGHWGPPGYHLVLLTLLFWPGSLVTLHALRQGLARTVTRPFKARVVPERGTLLLTAWIFPAWLVFELVGTKLPHYTMPLYPPIALLTARTIFELSDRASDSAKRVPDLLGLVVWTVLGLGLAVAVPILVSTMGAGTTARAAAIVAGIASATLIIGAAFHARWRQPLRTHALGVAAQVIFAWSLLHFVLPDAQSLRVTDQLASVIDQYPLGTPVAAVGYHEDSLVFATRGRLVRLSADQADTWTRNTRGLIILPTDQPAPFAWQPIDRVRGFNYSGGDPVDLTIYTGVTHRPTLLVP